LLAKLDTAISEGKEARLNDTAKAIIGKKLVTLEEFVERNVVKGIWEKK
jgi:hypothetical protein